MQHMEEFSVRECFYNECYSWVESIALKIKGKPLLFKCSSVLAKPRNLLKVVQRSLVQ